MSADEVVLRAHVDAVEHLLDRVQTDPDLAYLIGPGTEAWRRLTLASARRLFHGRDRDETLAQVFDEVQRQRLTRRPAEPPRAHVLRHLIDLLRFELSAPALARIDASHDAWLREQRELRARRTTPPPELP